MGIKYSASALFQYGWVKGGLVFNINMFHKCKILYKFIIVCLCLIYFGQVFWICISLLEMAYGVALSVGLAACCSWSKLVTVVFAQLLSISFFLFLDRFLNLWIHNGHAQSSFLLGLLHGLVSPLFDFMEIMTTPLILFALFYIKTGSQFDHFETQFWVTLNPRPSFIFPSNK